MTASSPRRLVVLLTVAFVFLAAAAFAQTGTGEINGTITDRSGGSIAGASVRLTNQATKVQDQAQTNASGYYVFINVHPGGYVLAVEAPGFKKVEVSFSLSVNQIFTQNAVLDVGSTTETLTVSAEAPLLQQSSAELGTVISGKSIQDMPLNGRNFTQLLILTPGANPVSTAQGSGVGFQDAGITGIPGTAFFKPSLHGQQNRSVLYYLDGLINTDFRGSIYGVLPIIDAVEEFKVASHDEKTEFGGVLGGVVNVVSKSGTNQFHGSAWEFVRNNAFDARNPFTDFCNAARCGAGANPLTPAPPVPYHQNEFGVAAGGPIIRNKTFFYAAYEGWRFNKANLNLTLVPTPTELAGDFSKSYYNQPIYNPYSTVCNGANCTRDPFPGNIIPGSVILPAMQQYLKAYVGTPNVTGITGSDYIETRPQHDTSNSWSLRLDQNFSERDQVFLRLNQMWVDDTQPVVGVLENTPSTYHAYNFGGGWNHMFKPNLILDVRAGAVLKPYQFNQAAAVAGTAPATSAGFKNVDQYGGMVTNFAGPYYTSDTGQRGVSDRGNPSANWDAGLNWMHGNHHLKFGAEYIYVNRYQNNLFQQYTFADLQTSNLGAAKTGNSVASALLGTPNTYTGQLPQYAAVYFKSVVWSMYVQDEWKIRPNFSLNWGLRYEFLPKLSPLNNRLSNDLDLFHQKWLIGAGSVAACTTPFVDPCIPGGINAVSHNDAIVFTGQQSAGPDAIYDNFGPRVGIAWNFMKNTVLRAGYGLYYDTISARSQYLQNTVEGPAWPWTTGIGTVNANQAVGGVQPGAAGNPLSLITNIEGSFPNPFVAATPWASAGGGYVNAPAFKNARSQQWNVAIQRQLSGGTMLEAAFVGSHSTRLDYTGWANAAKQASPNGTASAVVDTLRLMPYAAANWHYSQSIGWGNYEALEMKFQKRFTNGLQTLISYTWSKTMDTSSGWFAAENGTGGGSVVQNYFTPNLNYGPAAYNVPQLLVWSTVYDLPFGRGRPHLSHGPASWILGNWQVNYAFAARSGQPFNLNTNGDVANISGGLVTGYSRPNLVGDPTSACSINGVSEPSGTYKCFYNPAAFASPVASFGNLGKDILHGEHWVNLDFSLVKTFPIREAKAIQLRFEGFNVLNFQILANPAGTTIGNANAGQVTGIASTPRQLQFGAKILF